MAKQKKKAAKATKKTKVKKTKAVRRLAKKKTKKTAKSVKKSKKKVARSAARKPAPKRRLIERELEEGLVETFPASDPVALTDPTLTIKGE